MIDDLYRFLNENNIELNTANTPSEISKLPFYSKEVATKKSKISKPELLYRRIIYFCTSNK